MKGFMVARKWIAVCDICGTADGVVHFLVNDSDGGRGEADLCPKHSVPVRQFIVNHAHQTRRRRVMRVVNPEDIPSVPRNAP